MEFPQEVKAGLNELPPPERVVALALKNIYEEIRKLHEQEQAETSQSHMGFISRFKEIQVSASKIITGRKLTKEDLANPDQYFLPAEKADMEKALSESDPLPDYWLTALKNSIIKNIIKEKDEQILSHLTDISTNVTTDTIQVTLTFKDNEYLPACAVKRIIQLENGAPVEFRGDLISPKQALPDDSLISDLCTNSNVGEVLFQMLEIISYLANELVPYSLQFYLGEVDEEDELDGFAQEEDDGDSGEDESEEKPVKKTKPN